MKSVWALGVAITVPLLALVTPVLANHSWNGYHWKRTSQEVAPPVGDNVSAQWDSALGTAVSDWDQSAVINSPLVAGSSSSRRCRAVAGTIQVCNSTYGNNGWLGLATIWLSDNIHISQGTVKLNDTYFNSPTYNTPPWRALVVCQEVGHNYGLAHQDENFDNPNLGTCMDYTRNPTGPPDNEHPNAHDYDELVTIYNHFDSGFSAPQMAGNAEPGDTPAEWGRPTHFLRDGRPDMFERFEAGRKVVTHVFWALGQGPRRTR